MTVVTQKSFAGGIMGPMMLGRSDDPKYQAGLKVCRNFICLPQGAVQNRPGFAYVAEAKYPDKRVRLIPFTFSRDQTMILEFGHKYVRFHTNGKTLQNDDGTPYEIASPYDADDVMKLHYIQSADILTLVHHSYPPAELKRYSVQDWRFETISFNPTLAAPKNVKAVKATTAENEINADKYTFKYCVTSLNADRTIQSERSAIAWCTANIYNTGTTIKISWDKVDGAQFYRVYRNEGGVYSYIGETEELEIIDDNIAPDSEYTPPRIDDLFHAANGISAVTVTNSGSGYSDVVNGVKSLTSVDKSFVGSIGSTIEPTFTVKVQIVDDGNSGSGAKATAEFTSSAGPNRWTEDGYKPTQYGYTVTVTAIKVTNPGKNYLKPRAKLTLYAHHTTTGQGLSSGREVDSKLSTKTVTMPRQNLAATAYVTDKTGRGAELQPVVVGGKITEIKVVKSGENYSEPKVVIKASVGSGATATATVAKAADYPQCVTYFEQRRVFAATPTQPQGIWMTRTGTGNDFTYSIPVRPDDRVSFKIASRERHEIFHLVPLNRLIVLTEAGEWVVTSVNSDAITPESVQLKSQSFVGANMVQPLIVNNTVLYAAARGGHIRELGYNYNAGGYVTGDVSIRAAHLFDSYEVLDGAFAKAPYPIGWFVSSSGKLLGFTYVPDQQIGAWHEHTTDGVFESVAAVAENKIDAVYCVVQREVEGEVRRFIERMGEREHDDDADAFFVDCGGTYSGEPTDTVTGLSWLEGKTVNILADGAEMPQQVVKDGTIKLDVEARTIHVGLPIDAEICTLPVTIPMKDGSDGGSVTKNVNSVFMRVYRSSGIFIGPEDGEDVEFRQRTTEDPGSPPDPVTGGVDIDLQPEWSDSGAVSVKQKSPLPLTILSIAANMQLGG